MTESISQNLSVSVFMSLSLFYYLGTLFLVVCWRRDFGGLVVELAKIMQDLTVKESREERHLANPEEE